MFSPITLATSACSLRTQYGGNGVFAGQIRYRNVPRAPPGGVFVTGAPGVSKMSQVSIAIARLRMGSIVASRPFGAGLIHTATPCTVAVSDCTKRGSVRLRNSAFQNPRARPRFLVRSPATQPSCAVRLPWHRRQRAAARTGWHHPARICASGTGCFGIWAGRGISTRRLPSPCYRLERRLLAQSGRRLMQP